MKQEKYLKATTFLPKSNISSTKTLPHYEDFATLKMVEQGFGVTILPRLLLEQAPFRVCVRPFDAHYTRTLGVAWSDADNPAPAIRKFLDYISALPVGSGISPLHSWYSSSTDEKI